SHGSSRALSAAAVGVVAPAPLAGGPMLYCIPLFTALTLLYPPAYLTRIAALRPVFDRINHTLGRTPPPPTQAQAAAPDAPPDAPPPAPPAVCWPLSGAPSAGGPQL
ncbi:MAG: hypothetical protein ABF665_19130, partial [Gluconacetobacter sp.]